MSNVQNLNFNSLQLQKNEEKSKMAETAGTLASTGTNTPSPLYNAVSSGAETAGSVASSGSSSSSGGGFTMNA